MPITTILSLNSRLETLKTEQEENISLFSYLVISLAYFCTPLKVTNSTEPLLDDINDVSNKIRVIHYDCSRMKENKRYALTQVSPCKITPENIQIVDTHVTLYQRSY